jgi:hypothetical protein
MRRLTINTLVALSLLCLPDDTWSASDRRPTHADFNTVKSISTQLRDIEQTILAMQGAALGTTQFECYDAGRTSLRDIGAQFELLLSLIAVSISMRHQDDVDIVGQFTALAVAEVMTISDVNEKAINVAQARCSSDAVVVSKLDAALKLIRRGKSTALSLKSRLPALDRE